MNKARVGSEKNRGGNYEALMKWLGKIMEHILPDKAYDHKNRAETNKIWLRGRLGEV